MMGDAQRIYFEASGATKGTEFVYSSADGILNVEAGTTIAMSGAVTMDSTLWGLTKLGVGTSTVPHGGVGGGIVIDGKLVRGEHGFAAEFGHMLLQPGKRQSKLNILIVKAVVTCKKIVAYQLVKQSMAEVVAVENRRIF